MTLEKVKKGKTDQIEFKCEMPMHDKMFVRGEKDSLHRLSRNDGVETMAMP